MEVLQWETLRDHVGSIQQLLSILYCPRLHCRPNMGPFLFLDLMYEPVIEPV